MDLVDWRALMGSNGSCPFARALLEDLFAMAQAPWLFGAAPGVTPTSLRAASKLPERVLRNA
jgi:hypothetical protein